MPTLYVTEPGATVRRRGEALRVTPPRAEPGGEAGFPPSADPPATREFELHRLELLGLVGRVHVTAEAFHACLERGVGIAWLSYDGRLLGRLVPEAPRSADLRLRQYAACQDQAGRLRRAAGVIAAKAANAAAVLRDLQANYPDNPALPPALASLRDHRRALATAHDRDSLLGWEGLVARTYFQALGTAFRAEIGFAGRRQRPAPDPANALLSFGYVLLGQHLAGRLEARGLDPALGFFHEVRPGRPSLALDLLEEFRHPVVDRFVLRLCNLRILRPEHFEPDPNRPGGVRLRRDALKRFFQEWEAHLHKPLRVAGDGPDSAGRLAVLDLLDRQIERLATDFRGGTRYEPFRYGPGRESGSGASACRPVEGPEDRSSVRDQPPPREPL